MFQQLILARASRVGVILAVALAAATGPAAADSVADFYKDRTIDLIIGSPPGGAYDVYGRLIARHIGGHIPGHPTVVPQNMPGADALKAANYLYNVAPKDGTNFGIVTWMSLMEPMFGDEQALFNATKFSWLGSAASDVNYCVFGKTSEFASFDQWLKSGRQLTFGSAGVLATEYSHAMVLKNVLGASLQVISGYGGLSSAALAVTRGEVDGMCGITQSTATALFQNLLDSGQMKLVIQMGAHKDDTFDDIPSVFDYVKTEEQRQILSLAFDLGDLSRPFIAPPAIPEDRYEALAKAFAETLQDPALLAEAAKMKLDIDYVSAEKASTMLKQFADYPSAVVKKARLALGRP